jgi:hypothetical protein
MADTGLPAVAEQSRASPGPPVVHSGTFIQDLHGRARGTPQSTNHSERKQMIFIAWWHIVPLIVQPSIVFDYHVQNSDFPSATIASPDPWEDFVTLFRKGQQPLPQAWADLFGPLRSGKVDDLVVVGQLGQSLDGRIATETGHSKYINGPAGLEHLHRLRALVDGAACCRASSGTRGDRSERQAM